MESILSNISPQTQGERKWNIEFEFSTFFEDGAKSENLLEMAAMVIGVRHLTTVGQESSKYD
jgi:hypothetical protein